MRVYGAYHKNQRHETNKQKNTTITTKFKKSYHIFGRSLLPRVRVLMNGQDICEWVRSHSTKVFN